MKNSLKPLYGDSVHYDSAGSPGTAWPIGTPTNPCNSLADVRTILVALNLHKIVVHGSLTLDATMQGYHFVGFNPLDYNITLDINGQDVDDSIFENLHIVGAMGGTGLYTFFKHCLLGHGITNFSGWATDCALTGMVTLAAGADVDWHNIQNYYGGPTVSVGNPYELRIFRYSGRLNLRDMTGGSLYLYCSGGAYIYIQSTCTGGQIFIYGDAAVRDQSGASCNVRLFTLRAEQKSISANVTTDETDILVKSLGSGEATSIKSMRLKCADPGANTVTIRLYERVGAALTEVDSFDIEAANFGTYHSLMDMFGVPHIVTTDMKITGQASAGGPYAITGYYCLGV